jgi:hypothetical protein
VGLLAARVNRRTRCLDVLDDIVERRLIARPFDVVVVVQDQNRAAAVLASELERLGDPRVAPSFASAEVRRVVGRRVRRRLVYHVDELGVRATGTTPAPPTFPRRTTHKKAKKLRGPHGTTTLSRTPTLSYAPATSVETRPCPRIPGTAQARRQCGAIDCISRSDHCATGSRS